MRATQNSSTLSGSTGTGLIACLDSSEQDSLSSLVIGRGRDRVLFRRQIDVVAERRLVAKEELTEEREPGNTPQAGQLINAKLSPQLCSLT